MNRFYEELKTALALPEGDIWSETVLAGEHAGEKRLSCGGGAGEEGEQKVKFLHDTDAQTRIYRERIGRTPKMIICGAGHVSMPIIRMGKMLGFTVTVIEDRPKFADHARASGADQVLCEPFSDGLSKIRGDSDSWFIIVTRGHRYDTECLEAILQKPYAYVGMMGSRRRVAIVKDQLEVKGVCREALDGVHTPIGLKIGAETPEEIAVSVMAEIIQVKNAGSAKGGYSPELLDAVLDPDDSREKVLATIISRKGSAPRSVGTKMLIRADGTTVDTIGGGCIESEVIQKALLMIRAEDEGFRLCTVDMTADAAEDEGMVCGGVVEVMLEKV
ncbi:MAG TPA: XdhC family protein [Candidatus Mediterraneibacter excrementavium]|nr:XdhC family protein [Candidatus Mediterraneibacter excrementavium]